MKQALLSTSNKKGGVEEVVLTAECNRATPRTNHNGPSGQQILMSPSLSKTTTSADDEMKRIKEEERLAQLELRPAVTLALDGGSFEQQQEHGHQKPSATREAGKDHHCRRVHRTRTRSESPTNISSMRDHHPVNRIRRHKRSRSVSPKKNVHSSGPSNTTGQANHDDNEDPKTSSGKAATKEAVNASPLARARRTRSEAPTVNHHNHNHAHPTNSAAQRRHLRKVQSGQSPTRAPNNNNDRILLEEIKKEQERITQLNPAYTLAFRRSEKEDTMDADANRIAKEMAKNNHNETTTTNDTAAITNGRPKVKAVFRKVSHNDDTDEDWRGQMSLMKDDDDDQMAAALRVVDPSQNKTTNGIAPRTKTIGIGTNDISEEKRQAMNSGGNIGQPPLQNNGDDELDLLKLAETRSRAFADVSELTTTSSTHGVPAFAENRVDENNDSDNQEDEDDDSHHYSQHSKKCIAGPVQPGAYGASPGNRPSRNQSLRFSRLTHPSHLIEEAASKELMQDFTKTSSLNDSKASNLGIPSLRTHDEQEEGQSNTEGLVEARPINDSMANIDVEMVAEPAHRQSEEEVAEKEHKFWMRTIGSIAPICLVVIIIIIVTLYFTDVIFPDDPVLVTKSPTAAPSESPSFAPTFYPHHLDLPDYTLQAIQDDPQSPQALAYEWIQEDGMFETAPPFRQMQRFVLATFYFATGGPDWTVNTNWMSPAHHECLWHTKGVDLEEFTNRDLCDPEGHYLELILTKNELTGRLPPELSLLPRLQYLDVAANEVTGTIPSEIGLMTSLIEFVCDVNMIWGTLPTEFGLLTDLETLYVHSNSNLSGTLPTELGLLTNIKDLQWLNTRTTGSIPSELGMLTKMTKLFLNANQLTGTLPTEFGLLTSLSSVLNLGLNYFTGTLPSELGLLSNLELFYIGGNDLTGTTPTEIGTMTSLAHFFVDVNKLSGGIPSEIGLLSNMEIFLLNDNSLSATIPSEIGTMSNVTYIFFNDNNLNGPIPTELGLLESLEYLQFYSNQLSSTLPWELGNLAALGSLDTFAFNDTLVSGEIPSDLCVIPELHFDCSSTLCGCYCICLETFQDLDTSVVKSKPEEQEENNLNQP